MDDTFKHYLEALHPSFEQLMNMAPVAITRLPRKLPSKCIYLFSEGDNHLYVGRTRKLRSRLRQHSIPSCSAQPGCFCIHAGPQSNRIH